MPTYPSWEREVLEQCYEIADHISLHMYFENYEKDVANFLAKPVVMERYIDTIIGTADYVKAKTRSSHTVNISFDEWNVWYHNRGSDAENIRTWDWPVAPPLLEDVYNFEDVLVVACILNAFIRRADRVKIACIAQLVNVIAPIMTENGGPAWKQTTYYPLYFASLHGRGEALSVAVDVATYDAKVADDVPYLDIAAVKNPGNTVTFFVVNRHPDEALALDLALDGFKASKIEEHIAIAHPSLTAVNTAGDPEQVKPAQGKGLSLRDGRIRGKVPPLSYHVIRVAV
jgi:alpha-N-arabinofuranosidase